MMGLLVDRLLGPRVLLADRIDYAQPRELGLRGEEVEIARPGGGRIRGFWSPGEPGAPEVLFCPGNSANLSGHLAYLELLSRSGLGVLGIDYSGFGRSEGRPSLRSLLGDALAAVDALRSLAGKKRGLSPGAASGPRVGVFGVSLGANIALEVAARQPEVGAAAVEGLSIQREMVRGILEGGAMGPLSVERVRDGERPPAPRLRHRFPRRAGAPRERSRGFPRPFLWGLPRLAELCYPFPGKDPRRAAARMERRPVFVIHGAEDLLLPFEAALAVRRSLRGPGRLWLIPDAGHAQEPALLCDDEYSAQLGSFFREALGEGGIREPALGHRVEPRGGAFRLRFELRGPAGPYLVAVVAGRELWFLRVWAEAGAEARLGGRAEALAEGSLDLPAPPEELHALLYHHAERRGDSWAPREGERARCFSRVGEAFRRASAALIEGRLPEADGALSQLESEALPPAFDIARRLHRARRASLGAR